ncbi:MAG: flagellar brake protein [Wenzhouxiangellaceae bacterium]|nr:flagellar brake protein [Wenzhouxiangellaceae bacterium]
MNNNASLLTQSPSSGTDVGLIIEPGIQANVQIGRLDDNLRLQAHFIGCLAGKSVLITMPTHRGDDVQCYLNDNLTLRYFHGREIHGFKSSVLAVVKTPFSYLHLSYPTRIEKVQIRSEPRLQTELKARVQLDGRDQPIDACIIDISTQGAKLRLAGNEVETGDRLRLQFELKLGDKSEAVDLAAEVRSVKPSTAVGMAVACGVQFDALVESDRLLLSSFVYATIMNQRLGSSD